jgi:excisionase family DNA binding protein
VSDELTTGQAAELLGVSRRHVSRLVASGALPPLRRDYLTGWYVLSRKAVEAYTETVRTSH